MSLTERELWTVIHGMVLGAGFLLAFAGGFAGFYSLRPPLVTAAGVKERIRRLAIGTWGMAVLAWATVITGTWIVYPWYREDIPTSPRSLLIADPTKSAWHTFGMEWKEHVAWISPILATVVAFGVTYYGTRLVKKDGVRKALMVAFTVSFLIAGVAGAFGAFLNKVAPIR